MSLFANFLTLLRIAVIPFIIWGFFLEDKYQGAEIILGLFFAASITDWLDGKLARMFNATSKFGAMLDPIADKLLVSVVLIMLVYDRQDNNLPRADLVPVLIIICREIMVSGLREFLGSEQIAMPVTKLAKWKTTVQFFAILALLSAPLVEGVVIKGTPLYSQQIGQILLWAAAVLTFLTGWKYFRHTMREGFHDKQILQVKLVGEDDPLVTEIEKPAEQPIAQTAVAAEELTGQTAPVEELQPEVETAPSQAQAAPSQLEAVADEQPKIESLENYVEAPQQVVEQPPVAVPEPQRPKEEHLGLEHYLHGNISPDFPAIENATENEISDEETELQNEINSHYASATDQKPDETAKEKEEVK